MLPTASHTFAVKATDPAGNTSAETSYAWTVDTDAPATSLTAKPNDPSNDTTPSFSFSAGEAGSTFACKLDAGAFALLRFAERPSPHSRRGSTPSASGRPIPPATPGHQRATPWTIDTAAPTTTITQKPTDPSNSKGAELRVHGQRGRQHLLVPTRRCGLRGLYDAEELRRAR